MTDEMIPAEKVREVATAMREAMRSEDPKYSAGRFLADMSDYIQDLHDLLPSPTTLADMTLDEQAACQWMQASFKKSHHEHIITQVFGEKARLLRRVDGAMLEVRHDEVIPYPDLPRFVWPGDIPDPALPGGWRLADHKDDGRVVVTNPASASDGRVYYVMPNAGDDTGYDWLWCDPSELTYLDTTSDVPPNTLAVGSVWDDADALARACEETGRDQIVVLDRTGNAYVWDEMAEWWEGSAPPSTAPYTIIHTGRKADQ